MGPHAENQIEMSELGRLLAMTANDEVNVLACVRFAKNFGRSNVYQPASSHRRAEPAAARPRTAMSEEFRGRQLFTTGTTLAELQSRLDAGAVVKKTTLTDVFDLAAFRRTHPEAIPMFLLAPHGDLLVVTEDITAPPAPVTR